MYPESMNHVHSNDITYSKNVAYGDFMGLPLRARHAGDKIKPKENNPSFLILGVSVTNGCGNSYEDFYWVRLERLLNNTSDFLIKI